MPRNSTCLDFKSSEANAHHPPCKPTIYLHGMRFAYLQLMRQGFNFLLPEINITLLEQMGGGMMGSMKKKQDNGTGSDTELAKVLKLHYFHMASPFPP